MGLASKCCLGGYAGIYNTADINKINPFLLWIYNRLWLSNSPNLAMKRLPTVYRDGIWWCCSSTKAKTIKFLWTQLTVAGLVWFHLFTTFYIHAFSTSTSISIYLRSLHFSAYLSHLVQLNKFKKQSTHSSYPRLRSVRLSVRFHVFTELQVARFKNLSWKINEFL